MSARRSSIDRRGSLDRTAQAISVGFRSASPCHDTSPTAMLPADLRKYEGELRDAMVDTGRRVLDASELDEFRDACGTEVERQEEAARRLNDILPPSERASALAQQSVQARTPSRRSLELDCGQRSMQAQRRNSGTVVFSSALYAGGDTATQGPEVLLQQEQQSSPSSSRRRCSMDQPLSLSQNARATGASSAMRRMSLDPHGNGSCRSPTSDAGSVTGSVVWSEMRSTGDFKGASASGKTHVDLLHYKAMSKSMHGPGIDLSPKGLLNAETEDLFIASGASSPGCAIGQQLPDLPTQILSPTGAKVSPAAGMTAAQVAKANRLKAAAASKGRSSEEEVSQGSILARLAKWRPGKD